MRIRFSVPQITLSIVVFIVLMGVVVFRPYWGLMDDSMHLFYNMPWVEREGLLRAAWQYGLHDLEWGMFRPTYLLMVYPLYKLGLIFGPPATFFLNAIFSFFCIFLITSVVARIVSVRREWALVGVSAFFYQYDLFQYPSLQEKLLLLTGACLLRLSWGQLVLNRAVHFFLLAAVFLVGVSVKASFMIFFSMALWAYFSANRENLFIRRSAAVWGALGIFSLAGLGALAFLAHVSSKEGGYTKDAYSLAKVVPNLLSMEGALFVGPLLFFLIWVARRPKLFLAHPEKLTAFWGVLAFLVIFLPWGIKAYVQSVIGPVFVCLCLQLAEGFFVKIPAKVWQIPLTVLAISTAIYRIPTMFIRLHDIGVAVAAVPDWEKRGVRELFVPCMEGADSMGRYLKHFAQSEIKVTFLKDFRSLEGKDIFFDLALCPLPGRTRDVPGCANQEVVFTGSIQKSFKLIRASACSSTVQ